MPGPGEEGYEYRIICPYEKSHEVRKGKFQRHLMKCRKEQLQLGKDLGVYIQCPFNSKHIVPKIEEQYHTEEDCSNQSTWYRFTHQVGDPNCPVKDLVKVTEGELPESEENWDNFEAQGSVLDTIKEEASKKKIYRSLQCEPKSKRRQFRNEERLRHSALEHMNYDPDPTVSNVNNGPVKKPTKTSIISVTKQDPEEAVAQITKQFRSLDMKMKPSTSAASDTSSMYNLPPSTIHSISETPLESGTASRSESSMSYASCISQCSKAMSSALSSTTDVPISRSTTASNIAASANRPQLGNDDVFCQRPIPGLGRGARRKV